MEYVSRGVSKTHPAGLEHVGWFDGRFGDRDVSQAQHL